MIANTTIQNPVHSNPVKFVRTISNCYKSSEALIASIIQLQQKLDKEMQPALYATDIVAIYLHCSFSYYDHDHCKTNYVIADEQLKLKHKDFYPTLLKMYSKQEIESKGYYLRNRFEYSAFRNGKIKASIHFEKAFSDLSFTEQQKQFATYVTTAFTTIIDKLKKKKIEKLDLLSADFTTILNNWLHGR